jgi:hypothetical protein
MRFNGRGIEITELRLINVRSLSCSGRWLFGGFRLRESSFVEIFPWLRRN